MIFEYDHYPIARQATFREQQSGIVRREEAIEVVNGEYDERPMTVKRLIKVSCIAGVVLNDRYQDADS